MIASLAELAAEGRLTTRDLDVLFVANGRLTRPELDHFLAWKKGVDTGKVQPLPLPDAANEIAGRICGCQYQDGGGTKLVEVDDTRAHREVTGTCVHCPQIGYTMGIVKAAIRLRAPESDELVIDGTRFEQRIDLPTKRQLTMAMLMNEFDVTWDDLDIEFERHGQLTDSHLVALATRARIRQRLGISR